MRVWQCVVVGLLGACRSGGRDDAGGDATPRCVAPARPQLSESIALQAVYEDVAFDEGVALARRPDDASRWYLVTKPGVVHTFAAQGDPAPRVFADISDRVEEASEAGLLGLAFHPRFADNGYVFFSYTTPGGTRFLSRIARFESRDGGLTIDPGSERVVLEVDQPYSNHDGGDLHFGPDGFLYAGWGDGGAHSDPRGNGQDRDTLLGAIVRIDVDAGEPYAIPPDNPFAAGGGAPEIFAYGFRNPWRFTFDRATGDLWAGDVGQNLWEEVDRVVRGGNYGWNVREGHDCFGRDACDDASLVAPVAQYENRGGASVVGGFVYRGTALEKLTGAYVYSDYYQGTIWAVREGEDPIVLHRSGGRRIAAWSEDADGELYGVQFDGAIVRVVAAPEPEADRFPRTLSQTGCVVIDDVARSPDALVPYEVALSFWSDGADKIRAIALPDGATMSVDDEGDFDLPPGTVITKSFVRDGAPIETRLLVHHDDGGWAGYSYAWRADGSDADFVPDGATATLGDSRWIFPSVEDCAYCHTRAAGSTLGLEVAQLAVGDQLDRFVEIGILGARPDGMPLVAPDDDTASIEARARDYLHVNCAQCHRPDGPSGRADLDLRRSVALVDTGLCASPNAGDAELLDARVLAPGAPDRSTLLARMRSQGSIRMPPIGSALVDETGAALVESWIAALPACP